MLLNCRRRSWVISTVFFWILLGSLSSWAQIAAPSAARLPSEDYRIKVRALLSLTESKQAESVSTDRTDSVLLEAGPYDDLNYEDVQEWPATESFSDYFSQIRDERFIQVNPDFPRRSSWLYPDDGCFARAAISSARTETMGLPLPSRIFVFGNLNVKSSNSLWGQVTWWYHVAVGFRVGPDILVLDPSIEAQRPLKLEEWLDSMGDRSQMRVALCSAGAYSPNSRCHGDRPLSFQQSLEAQKPYLQHEWTRLKDLGRQPEIELGDHPPWR